MSSEGAIPIDLGALWSILLYLKLTCTILVLQNAVTVAR
jgi:hypothetical protein